MAGTNDFVDPRTHWTPETVVLRSKRQSPIPVADRHTIASLSLNVDGAESGRMYELLPPDYRYLGDKYPLPTDIAELARLTALPIKPGRPRAGASGVYIYLKRCRAEYEKRRDRKALKVKAEREVVAGVEESVQVAEAGIKDAVAEVEVLMSDLRLKAAEATASLADLNALAKFGLQKIMQAFNAGEELNGELIAPSIFVSAADKVLRQVAKLGDGALDPAGREEAESEVFEEFQRTKDRLMLSSGARLLNMNPADNIRSSADHRADEKAVARGPDQA
jgi:hypothetical protein